MTVVALLAKAPRPGVVKTRLAAVVGDARATAAYRRVGSRVARAVAERHHLTVWYDPPDAESDMRAWLGPDVTYRPQPPGDLGVRLETAFAWHFARGAARVIAIGADAPDVSATVIDDACRGLERADVVIGPTPDGGYYLIALRHPLPHLFRAIPWSTPRVLEATRARCDTLGVDVIQLTPLRDLDTAEDLAALRLECP